MELPTQIAGLIVILTAAAVVGGDKYLTEKPDYITTCYKSDPAFNSCYAKHIQLLYSELKFGNLNPLDPLSLKRIAVTDDGSGSISLNLELTNIVIKGLSQAIVDDASFEREKLVSSYHVKLPKMSLVADYVIKGHVLALQLDGRGKMNMNMENADVNHRFRSKLREEDGYTFIDVDKLRVNIENIGGFHINYENLFNGQRDLEEAANTLFNDSWRELFPLLKPSIEAAIQTVTEDRIRKMYAYIPGTYVLGDL